MIKLIGNSNETRGLARRSVCDSSDATRTAEPKTGPDASLDEMERDHILRVLAESPTLEDAAETLGINVSTLWRKRYKID